MAKWILQRVTTEPPKVSPGGRTAPETPVSPASPARGPRLSSRTLAIGGAALAALALWASLGRRSQGPESSLEEPARTASVARQDFVRSMRIHGVVEAVHSHMVAAPRLAGPGSGPMVITHLVAAGTRVKPSDLLVEFDPQSQIKTALDRRAEYLDLEEQIKKKKAENLAAEAKDQTELKQAENALEAARLEMRRNEVLSRIDAEKNQQNLEEAEARLKQLRETLELKGVARLADLRILEIQRDRARNAMRHAQQNAEKMAIRSPLEGLVVLNPIWKAGGMAEVQEGDEVRPGAPFLQVVDPAAMQVRARVNQADFPYLRGGQQVEIHLDAYPELRFSGRVEGVAAVGATSNLSEKVRTFAATFSIQGNDPRLLPDLSAAVDVELERLQGVLVLPRDATETENGHTYVRVKAGRGFERRAVQIRAMNEVEAVAESGVEEGATVERKPGGNP